MTHSPDPDSDDDIDPGSGASATGAPRWAKACGLIGLVLVVLVVVLLLVGGESHGPGRHGSSAGAVAQAPTAGSAAESLASPTTAAGRTATGG